MTPLKRHLMKALNASLAPGVHIIDQIQINPNVDALDFSKAKPLFTDSASITDFKLTVSADTLTLAGTAATQDQKNAVDNDAKHIWSNLNVVDNLAVAALVPPPEPAATARCGRAVHRLAIRHQRRDRRADRL